jgi:hypothetical protein
MQHPKATLFALSQLTENIQDEDALQALARAVVQISDLGNSDHINTVGVASAMLQDEGLNYLIESLRDSNCEINIAATLADLVVAVLWKCRNESYLKEVVMVSQQIDSVCTN